MRNGKRALLYGLCGVCVAGTIFSGWSLYQEMKPRMEAEAVYADIRQLVIPEPESYTEEETEVEEHRTRPDFQALKAWNPDVCGWISIPGTTIDYPIVQGSDNDYYLNHTADRKPSIIGSIFMESQNQSDFGDDVTVLYGHHIKGGKMFSPLSGYKKQSYYEEHPVAWLYTPEGDYQIELFAGEILNGQTGTFPLIFADEEERKQWLEKIQASSVFESQSYPKQEERILALCTCTYEYQDARFAVYGVMKELEREVPEDLLP